MRIENREKSTNSRHPFHEYILLNKERPVCRIENGKSIVVFAERVKNERERESKNARQIEWSTVDRHRQKFISYNAIE